MRQESPKPNQKAGRPTLAALLFLRPGWESQPLVLLFALLTTLLTNATPAQAQASPAATELDSVVAVVNNQAILASDLDFEMHVFKLLPIGSRRDLTSARSLERLTTRALIEQQILQQDPHGMDVLPKDLNDSLDELRQSLPACKQRDCVTEAGWASYLATLGLTPDRVADYWAHRMAVLRFIELRFRSGIRITPEEIAAYYKDSGKALAAHSGNPAPAAGQPAPQRLAQEPAGSGPGRNPGPGPAQT